MKGCFDQEKALAALRKVLGKEKPYIPLHEPVFCGNEKEYVNECIDTGWVSSAGKFVDRFERDLADYCGVHQVIAVVNGTAALHICLRLAGVKPRDEVLIPALTFVATANAVRYCDAIPHFVDSEERTLGMDPYRLNEYLSSIIELRSGVSMNRFSGRRISAVVPMHTFGHPVDLDPLAEVCARYKIAMVEDAAEAMGTFYKGRHTGNHGMISAVSFNGNKILTTGGGGAILTNKPELGKMAKHLTTTAKIPHPWAFIHDETGYNYRMPNINAALGCAQLRQLLTFLHNKRCLAEKYRTAFAEVEGINFFEEPENASSNYWLNVLLLEEPSSDMLENFLKLTNDAGIMTRPAWTLMPDLPMYKESPRMELPIARNLVARLVNIPSSANLFQGPVKS